SEYANASSLSPASSGAVVGSSDFNGGVGVSSGACWAIDLGGRWPGEDAGGGEGVIAGVLFGLRSGGSVPVRFGRAGPAAESTLASRSRCTALAPPTSAAN